VTGKSVAGLATMAKLLYAIICSLAVQAEEVLKDKENLRPVYKFLGLEPPPAGADKTVKMHPTDIPWYDYIGRKDPATGEVTCPWRRGRGKVPSGGSSGVQMAG